MKSPLAILLVILALCAVLYFTTPQATEIISKVGGPVADVLGKVFRMVAGIQKRAIPFALAIHRAVPERGSNIEGCMLAMAEHEGGFTFAVNSKTGAGGGWGLMPKYYGDVDFADLDATTAAAYARSIYPAWQKVLGAGIEDYPLACALTYLAHGEGPQGLISALHGIRDGGKSWSAAMAGVKAELAGKAGRNYNGLWNALPAGANYYMVGGRAQGWQEWYDGLDFAALEAGTAATVEA